MQKNEFFSNDIDFFIVNFSFENLLIVSTIARRFLMINIVILMIKNEYIEKHAGKKNEIELLKKINTQSIESNDFSIIKLLLAFYRYREHHYCSFEMKEHFHHFDGIIF